MSVSVGGVLDIIKVCSRCSQEKLLSEYHKHRTHLYGVQKTCKDCRKSQYMQKREHVLHYQRKYRKNNKERIDQYKQKKKKKLMAQHSAYTKNKYLIDSLYRIKHNVRTRIYGALKRKGWSKVGKSSLLLGCTYEQLQAHLESMFKEGMTWKNKGSWHIDHIIPLASAKTEEEIYRLCHYTNLQPLWAKDNLSKGAKLNE